jgi:hypothetical protein
MNIFQRLFTTGRKETPMPPFTSEETHTRERMHEEWERDYARRVKRAYDLERRTNYLTERLFAPVDTEEGERRGRQ